MQTMWPEQIDSSRKDSVLRHLKLLKEYGCDLIRFTVQTPEDCRLLGEISAAGIMPVVADVHYNHTLALEAIKSGVDKIRINPGTIGVLWKTREIFRSAADSGTAVRLGLNGGSLPKHYAGLGAEAGMLAAAEEYLELCEQHQLKHVVVSLKASDPEVTYRVNKRFSESWDYPLHIGVTEAGPLIPSIVKSTYALTKLLEAGIGDTLRVSISDTMEREVITAREILRMLGLVSKGVSIVSCPKCGRAAFNTHRFMERWEDRLHRIDAPLTIACMGCPVNGLEEAKHADLGITGAGRKVFIFRHGEIIRETDEHEAEDAFFEELDKLCRRN